MGPTTRSVTVTGGVTFDELIGHYRVQAAGLLAGGADVLLLETPQDTRNLKAGLIGVQDAFSEIGWSVPDHGLGHDRADGHDARRPGGRRAVRVLMNAPSPLRRAELRHRARSS